MGRPREFSRQQVLEKAIPVFWKRGFADTSIQDLEKATGVNKSGLYSEFKGKDDLFVASLTHYLEASATRAILSKEPLGWDNVAAILSQSFTCSGQKGCFAVNTVREISVLPPQARVLISDNMTRVRALLLKNIEAARTKGEPGSIADLILTFNSGLCLEQNFGAPQAVFARRVDDFMKLLRQL